MRDPNGRRRGAGSAGSAERTRILVPAEQGNRVRVPDTERSQPFGFAGSESGQRAIRAGPGGRLPKVAVFLKHCFPCGKSPRAVKTGHWKGCHGPERRLKQCVCAKKRTRSQRLQGFTRMNGSVRRPTKSKTGELRASQQEAVMLKSYQRICIAKICHRSDDCRNHRFCCFCGSLSLR